MMLRLHSVLLSAAEGTVAFESPCLDRRSRAIENVQGYTFIVLFSSIQSVAISFLPFSIQPELLFIYYYASECGKLGHFKAKVELWNV